jgi:hypothetical protein
MRMSILKRIPYCITGSVVIYINISPVLRIWDVFPGSGSECLFFPDPDPNIFSSRIRIRTFFIPNLRSYIKEGLKIKTTSTGTCSGTFFHAS